MPREPAIADRAAECTVYVRDEQNVWHVSTAKTLAKSERIHTVCGLRNLTTTERGCHAEGWRGIQRMARSAYPNTPVERCSKCFPTPPGGRE